MPTTDADSVRVTITLNRDIYDKIRFRSKRLGLRPATWISMVATSKANDVDLEVHQNGASSRVKG